MKKLFLCIVFFAMLFTGGILLSSCDNASGHTHDFEMVAAVTADCTHKGNVQYWHCKDCDKYYLDANGKNNVTLADTVIEITDHNLTKHSKVDGDCNKAGNIEYWECQACHKLFADSNAKTELKESQVVVPASHKLEKVEAKKADCKTNGNIEHWICEVCHKYFADKDAKTELKESQVVIPAAHKLDKVDAEPADCEHDGTIEYYTCSVCKKFFADAAGTTELQESDLVDPAGHKIEKVEAKDPTCTTLGNIEYYFCSVCEKAFKDENGSKEIAIEDVTRGELLPHTPVLLEAVTPDCENTGNIECYQCEVCKKYFDSDVCETELAEDEVILPIHHNLAEYLESDATCTLTGRDTYYKCRVCEKYFLDENGTEETTLEAVTYPMLPHTLSKTEAVEPTCLTKGNIEYWHCSVCDKYFLDEDATIASGEYEVVLYYLGRGQHEEEVVVDENGHSTVCKLCGEVFGAKEDHTYAEDLDLGCTVCGYGENYSSHLSFNLGSNKSYYVAVINSVGPSGKIVIPSEHEGLPVTTLAGYRKNDLIELEVPSSVTYINELECENLRKLTLNEGLVTLYRVESRCLQELIIPSTVTYASVDIKYFVSSSSRLEADATTIYTTLKEKPEKWYIGDCPLVLDYENNDVATDGKIYIVQDGIRYALYTTAMNTKCARVTIQSPGFTGIAKIPNYITYKDEKYEVSYIAARSFWYTGITELEVPSTMEAIYESAFEHCKELTKVIFNKTAKKQTISGLSQKSLWLDKRAFYSCTILKTVELAEGLVRINERCFTGAPITKVVIPSSCLRIGAYAFYDNNWYPEPAKVQSTQNLYFTMLPTETERSKWYFKRTYQGVTTESWQAWTDGANVISDYKTYYYMYELYRN
nr:leucine-rich repeat domain-containing protein [Anaeroplasmataceae bacterium]